MPGHTLWHQIHRQIPEMPEDRVLGAAFPNLVDTPARSNGGAGVAVADAPASAPPQEVP